MQNSDTVVIPGKIVSFDFLKDTTSDSSPKPKLLEIINEATERPAILSGKTYKLKSPVYEAALYITINDLVLNVGTPEEKTVPFEIFINSKAMDSFQWIVSLTRMISAVFRKGGDVAFIVDELSSVCDPRGGYWKKGKYISSIVAEIGTVVESHLINLGLIKCEDKKEANSSVIEAAPMKALPTCPKCGAPALVRESGCDKCLNCGWSKCS